MAASLPGILWFALPPSSFCSIIPWCSPGMSVSSHSTFLYLQSHWITAPPKVHSLSTPTVTLFPTSSHSEVLGGRTLIWFSRGHNPTHNKFLSSSSESAQGRPGWSWLCTLCFHTFSSSPVLVWSSDVSHVATKVNMLLQNTSKPAKKHQRDSGHRRRQGLRDAIAACCSVLCPLWSSHRLVCCVQSESSRVPHCGLTYSTLHFAVSISSVLLPAQLGWRTITVTAAIWD